MEDNLDLDRLLADHLLSKNKIIQHRDVDGFFHPSAIGKCTRKLWYAYCTQEPKHNISVKLRCTFDHGHAVHDWMQSVFHEIFDQTDTVFMTELSIRDQEYANTFALDNNIAGRTDGLIILPNGKRMIYELKTASDSSWSRTTKPQEAHVKQASIYAECFGADTIVFQYYNKNSDVNKFFYVPKDVNAVSRAKEQIDSVFEHLDAGKEPKKQYNSWECGSCPYYSECRPET